MNNDKIFGKVIEHEIIIEPTMNRGFIVRVGCQTFAFQNHRVMLAQLRKYLDAPDEFMKRYAKAQRELRPEMAEQPTPGNDGVRPVSRTAYVPAGHGRLTHAVPPSWPEPDINQGTNSAT